MRRCGKMPGRGLFDRARKAVAVAAVGLAVACATPPPPMQITLAWDDVSNGERGFTVQRREGETGEFREVGSTGPNLNSFTDSSVVRGRVYYYRVGTLGTRDRVLYSRELRVEIPD